MFNHLSKTLSVLVATLLFTAFANANHHGMKKDIVDVATENGSFTTLVAAVKAAGLVDTLKGDGPFTVFAPTDEAFAALPEGTVDMLLKPENKDKLVAVLTYHVVPGKIMAAEVMKLNSAVTVQGEAVMVGIDHDSVMINKAKVVMPDVEASNGVIHVIDAVLLTK
ncbi:fasciclin domain-containing protein [Vibrio cyclitrophicus]|nr:fasciclin domain-containing protein [Vibrio cyclitrophicus]UPR36990.1 fasciclin domain-containing protein [Vibrio cyclitrophicus]UPR54671.1 fasciclin domain-containing protein [Vibrio cyclitrophicus]